MKISKTKDIEQQNMGRKIKINSAAKQLNEVVSEDINTTNGTSDTTTLNNSVTKIQIETKDTSGTVAKDLNDKLDEMDIRREKRLEKRRKHKIKRTIKRIILLVILALIVIAFIINPSLNEWATTVFNDLKDLFIGVIHGEDVSNNLFFNHLFNIQQTDTVIYNDGTEFL